MKVLWFDQSTWKCFMNFQISLWIHIEFWKEQQVLSDHCARVWWKLTALSYTCPGQALRWRDSEESASCTLNTFLMLRNVHKSHHRFAHWKGTSFQKEYSEWKEDLSVWVDHKRLREKGRDRNWLGKGCWRGGCHSYGRRVPKNLTNVLPSF